MLKKIKGFTLIELMIVIAILAILAAIIIPNIKEIKNHQEKKELVQPKVQEPEVPKDGGFKPL